MVKRKHEHVQRRLIISKKITAEIRCYGQLCAYSFSVHIFAVWCCRVPTRSPVVPRFENIAQPSSEFESASQTWLWRIFFTKRSWAIHPYKNLEQRSHETPMKHHSIRKKILIVTPSIERIVVPWIEDYFLPDLWFQLDCVQYGFIEK